MSDFIMEGPRPLDMIASEASGQRSRDRVRITGNALLPPGTLLAGEVGGNFTAATGAGSCSAVLLYWADPREGPVDAAALTRDCEVNDAYLIYGDMDPGAVATTLRGRNIIVRHGVLANPATDFATGRQPWPHLPAAVTVPPAEPPSEPPSEPPTVPPTEPPETVSGGARHHRRDSTA